MENFYEYFKENMNALGLGVPDSFKGTAMIIASEIKPVIDAVEKYGTRVTIADLVLAGTLSEKYLFIGAIGAAYYVGAVIGSIAVAIQRCLGKGATIADIISTASQYNLNKPWLTVVLVRWSGIYDTKLVARATYRQQMMYA